MALRQGLDQTQRQSDQPSRRETPNPPGLGRGTVTPMQVGEEGQRAVLGCCGFQDRRLVGQDGREEMSLKCKELAELKTELFLPRQRAPRAPAGGQREPTHGGVPAFPDFKDKLLSGFHSGRYHSNDPQNPYTS